MTLAHPGVSNRNWLIIGGAGGLGAGIAATVEEMMRTDGTGCKVHITARTEEKAAKVAAGIDASRVIPHAVDATDEASVAALAGKVGSLDISVLVYCAGGVQPESRTPPDGSILTIPLSAVRRQLEVTLFGPVIAQTLIGAAMIDRWSGGGGLTQRLTFLHTSSASAVQPLPRVAAYSAAMRGVDSYIGSWQRELVQKYGPKIQVCGVRPGFIPTEQNRVLLLDPSTADGMTERGRTVAAGSICGRLGETNEIGGAYAFLASDRASFIYGEILNVCGGYLNRSTL